MLSLAGYSTVGVSTIMLQLELTPSPEQAAVPAAFPGPPDQIKTLTEHKRGECDLLHHDGT